LKQQGKAMIHSSRRDRKAKAIAEALAMLATLTLNSNHIGRVLSARQTNGCGEHHRILHRADRYAERAMEIKRESTASVRAQPPGAPCCTNPHQLTIICWVRFRRSLSEMPSRTSLARQGSLCCRGERESNWTTGSALAREVAFPVKPARQLASYSKHNPIGDSSCLLYCH
jgi:hypothetical protein